MLPSRPLNNALAATALAALFAVSDTAPLWADEESEKKGYDIAARADAMDNGFGDSAVDAQMVLRDDAGGQSVRDLSFTTLERANDDVGDKSLVVFRSPRDVEGTALLSHAQILEPDRQWLYLPGTRQTRRISSSNRSGQFLGSEFAFEDFTALELKKFTYDHLTVEEITVNDETFTADVIERIPAYEGSGYSRQVSYIDQDITQVRRVEYYDRRGDLIKILELTDYRQYENGIWRTHKMTMTNAKTGKETDLVYGEYSFATGLDDNDFVRGVLSRIR